MIRSSLLARERYRQSRSRRDDTPLLLGSLMAEADHKGSVTIGEGVIVHGTITAMGRATVYGSLDGEVTASDVLIGPSGRITGRLTADTVDIHGDGPAEVTAWQSLTVRATGRLNGTIHYARLEVEPGGVVDGELIPLADSPSEPLVSSAHSPTAAPRAP